MTARSQNRLVAAWSSVRGRIIVVILLATLPLAAGFATLAWRDYRWATNHSLVRLRSELAATLARERMELRSASVSLDSLTHLVDVGDPATCATTLAIAMALAPDRYLSIAASDHDGTPVCVAGKPLPVDGKEASDFGHVRLAPDGSIVFPMTRSIGGVAGGHILAWVRLPVPGDGFGVVSTWVVQDRRPLALGHTLTRPPDEHALAVLASGSAGRAGAWSDGRLYVGNRLDNGLLFVTGGFVTETEARAASVLFARIMAIGSLLAVGLLLVAVGAHVAVAAPIQALTRRVTHWREAGTFDDAQMRFIPAELTALIEAFGLATRSLALREKELERARQEQELAFKEIHHRVKNNLQIIASLLNLQGNRIRQPEAKAEFQSARDRVRALATLHRHLYADSGLHTIAMRSFLLELCGQLFQAIGEREGHRIRLDVESPELSMSSDQAVPVALIVTEAVSNAVKYAFPNGREGSISVRLVVLDGERISLTIQDDGVGIPAGRAETETGVRDGLGIQLIRGFARQLGAALDVTEGAIGGHGTRYHIELRLRQAAVEQARLDAMT